MSIADAKSVHQKDRVLTFVLNSEKYGVEIDKVQEIIAKMRTTPVPKTPDYIEGLMNLRGNIIPVVDMRLKFEMGESEDLLYEAIVIVRIGSSSVGFIVDSVEEVMAIEQENLTKAPDFGSQIDTSFIKSMARNGEEVIMILDLNKIFAEEELESLEQISQTKEI